MTDAFRTPLIAAVAALGLVACASEPIAPELRPAAPVRAAPAADASHLIYVTPMEGVRGPARLILADAIAAALRDVGKPAVLSDKPNEMGPTITGRVTGMQVRDTVLWVTAEWALKAPYGTPVAEYRQLIVVDRALWEKGSPEAINLVVSDAGPMVAGMARDYISPLALAEAPPMPKPAPALSPAAAETTAPAKPSVAEKKETPAEAMDAKASSKQTDEKTVPPAQEATPAPAETAPATKAASARPKRIARAPVKSPLALETAKATPAPPPAPTADRVETAAAVPGQPAAKVPPPDDAAGPGAPRLLLKGPPPRQPRPRPIEAALPRAKPLLMPVPDGKPKLEPDPPPVSWAKPSFLIKQVEGAPGDGNEALMAAMKAALRKRDLTVTDDPRQAGFIIAGRVEIGPNVNGRQQAKIIWAVNTITGQEVGKAVQENAVKAGSLDGAWGRVAEIVTNAAVVGIQELFGVEEKRSSRLDLPPVPPVPEIPRVPGRALPPPR